jgi:C4-dicarboxylate transporter
MVIIMNENLNATNNQEDKNKSTFEKKKTKCSPTNCTNFKYALLVIAASIILIATNIFSNKYFDYKEKNPPLYDNTPVVTIDHHNARKQMN